MHEHCSHSQLVPGRTSIEEAAAWIAEADRMLIAGGAGLSAAAGYDYGDEARFAELFPALHTAGFRARGELIGFPLPPRHQWGFWAVHTADIRFGSEPSPVYESVRRLVGARDHFVMSSNVDALFARNGFESDRIYTPQGDYALYQCLTPCTREVWSARHILDRALSDYDPKTGQTSSEAVPSCPNCGGEVTLNVYAGSWYINDHFLPQLNRLNAWLEEGVRTRSRMVLVEIGAGFNTPGVIRWPIERLTNNYPNAHLVRINRDHPGVPENITDHAASLQGEADELLAHLINAQPRQCSDERTSS